MALLFSAVSATANDQKVEFLAGGIPREYDDPEGWTAFDRFMEDIDEETEVAIHAEAYLYGEEETHRTTPEEVAYFMKRARTRFTTITATWKYPTQHPRRTQRRQSKFETVKWLTELTLYCVPLNGKVVVLGKLFSMQ